MDWEFQILNYIQMNFKGDFWDKIMPWISHLGNGILYAVIALACLFIVKARPFGKSLTGFLILGLIACAGILKPIVGRIRPYDLNTTVDIIVKAEHDYSFPSGHTFYSFGFATIVYMYNRKLGVLAYLFAAAVACSRLYLYVHFPTDIICGAIFGILIAVASYHIVEMLFDKNKPAPKLKSY